MIKVQEYRGHIRNWKALCTELEIDSTLSREKKEEQILIRAYETWGYEMAKHLYGMFAFALWDDREKKLFCVRDQFGTKPFYYYETADGKLLYGTMIRSIIELPLFTVSLIIASRSSFSRSVNFSCTFLIFCAIIFHFPLPV